MHLALKRSALAKDESFQSMRVQGTAAFSQHVSSLLLGGKQQHAADATCTALNIVDDLVRCHFGCFRSILTEHDQLSSPSLAFGRPRSARLCGGTVENPWRTCQRLLEGYRIHISAFVHTNLGAPLVVPLVTRVHRLKLVFLSESQAMHCLSFPAWASTRERVSRAFDSGRHGSPCHGKVLFEESHARHRLVQ